MVHRDCSLPYIIDARESPHARNIDGVLALFLYAVTTRLGGQNAQRSGGVFAEQKYRPSCRKKLLQLVR